MPLMFTKLDVWNVKHATGYTVEIDPNDGVIFRDGEICIDIPYDWLMQNGIAIFPNSNACKGMEQFEQTEKDAIVDKVVAALQFLGFKTEVYQEG